MPVFSSRQSALSILEKILFDFSVFTAAFIAEFISSADAAAANDSSTPFSKK